MFRNKVLIRAAAADSDSSSSPALPPFRLRQLSLSAPAPIPALDLEILCCRLSRRHRVACLPQPPADALLVFQGCQSREAAEAVSEIAAAFPGASVGEEEALECSGELIAKAVGCDLRSMMLEHGWRCLGESIYVDSKFDQNQERTDLCAVKVEVRLGTNDDFEFVVSPDAFRYTTHKISDVASSNMMETFQHNNEVVLDIFNIRTACTTLPALQEGHVIGYRKMLPSECCLDKFMELCLFKHGLDTNYDYHVAVKLTYGASLETKWWPSSLVLQGPGLQPALKSVRVSKAMSALQSFVELLKAWSFFGHNKLIIKEQVLLNCSSTLPAWDKAASNLTFHSSKNDNIEDLDSGHSNIMSKGQSFILDFRTPKPAVLCSLRAKLLNTEVHKTAHPLGDNYTLSCVNPINDGFQSQLVAPNSSYKSHVPLLKPSFSRSKSAEKRKLRYSSEHPDADNSNKSSHLDAVANHANLVSSSSAILHMPVIQVSENLGRNHAELLKDRSRGGGITKDQQDYLETKLDSRRKSKDYTPSIQEVTKAIPDIEKDVLTAKVVNTKLNSVVAKDEVTAEAKRKAKQDLDKNVLTAVTKQKTMPEIVKNEFATKVRDNQNDDLKKKVTKSRAKAVDKDILNSKRTKSKPDVASDELIAKVIDHHRRGELRLLTVADLKSFLGAKKSKVGGTKEVLIQRVTELLA
ncbi:uncharacterized protein LOC101769602 isoform X2 [Setaria italica]|uniref:uncharacterized protein LOC101769602 isoform X2 n=1 Tax=Setaria italica TaxID=4555 RepID=UPI000350CB2A|nr:uncharacterized protein LOC101769602 isoform X2 [Setaria italica]